MVTGAGAAVPLAITGRNRSCAVWPTVLAASPLLPGTEIDHPVAALGDHLGLGHAERVDPALDDLPGLVERLPAGRLAVGGAGLQRDGGAALRSSPSFGVAESPVKNTSA